MKISARQLAIDMYNCKPAKLSSTTLLVGSLKNALSSSGYTPLQPVVNTFDDDHFVIFLPLNEGSFSVHVHPDLKYAAADLFLCSENNITEKSIHALRKVFKPQESKMTYLCRGDFGTIPDMKPHIKKKTTPLRRIHKTGVKVIHLLPGHNFMKKLRRHR